MTKSKIYYINEVFNNNNKRVQMKTKIDIFNDHTPIFVHIDFANMRLEVCEKSFAECEACREIIKNNDDDENIIMMIDRGVVYLPLSVIKEDIWWVEETGEYYKVLQEQIVSILQENGEGVHDIKIVIDLIAGENKKIPVIK